MRLTRRLDLVVLFVLAGCATSYQKTGLTGGYSETQLDENVFRVTFRGNGYTGEERAADFALLRCAELALSNGFTHFVIVDAVERTQTSLVTTPQQASTTGVINTNGNSSTLSARTTVYGGQSFLVSRPRARNTIVCFKGKPDVGGLVYDATFLKDSLTQKYGLDKGKG